MAGSSSESDPFRDATATASERSLDTSATVLTVDRNATLTLGTDALIVLDEGLKHRRRATNCCGLLPQRSAPTRAIPFHDILWADVDDFSVSINYAHTSGNKTKKSTGCTARCIQYTITDKTHAKRWVEELLARAYPPRTRRRKRIKVLINPFGGQGHAQRIWSREVEPILAAARCEVEVERTAYHGHAIEIAQNLDLDAFDIIACASGDGLPHEVFNGLAKHAEPRRALRKIALCQIPCGSGNAMSLNFNGTNVPSRAAVEIVKGLRAPFDLMAVTQGDHRYYSFLSQAVGIVAESDLGTESLRWMGSFRFTWGILVRMLVQTVYPAEVSMLVDSDDKRAIKEAYRHTVEEYKAAASKDLAPVDDRDELAAGEDPHLPPLRYGTVLDPLPAGFVTEDMPTVGNFFVGNMCHVSPDAAFFAAALPADGRMDLMAISADISRLTSLRMLATADQGILINFPEVSYRKVRAYRIAPRVHHAPSRYRIRERIGRWLGGAGKQKEGLIAVDGERVPFEPFQAEIMPSLGTVLSRNGPVYEFHRHSSV